MAARPSSRPCAGPGPGLRARAGGTILSRGWRLAPPPFSLRSCEPLAGPPFLSTFRRAAALPGRGRAVGAALLAGAGLGAALARSGRGREEPGAGDAEALPAGPLPSGSGDGVWCPLRSSRCPEPAGPGLGRGSSPGLWPRLL